MVEEVHWYARTPKPPPKKLEARIEADVVVVGGGMAGLAAAEWLHDHGGRQVVLLESSFCGGSATGRSSGFITPDSELQVTDLVRRYGAEQARHLWKAVHDACQHIRANVARHGIACDLVQADCLYLGAGSRRRSTRATELGDRKAAHVAPQAERIDEVSVDRWNHHASARNGDQEVDGVSIDSAGA